MSLYRSHNGRRPRGWQLGIALSGLTIVLGCSGAGPRAAAVPAPAVAPVAPAPPVAPRFASEALAMDFRHPEREAALAALMPRLEKRIEAFFSAERPPSLAVAVVADGEVRLSRVLGWADVAGKLEASSQTLYRIGSVTKTFTTALVLSLRDEGVLELDRPAEYYWPELAGAEYPFPDAARITPRHLLTHTSGLPRLGGFDYTKPDSRVTDAVLLGALAQARLNAVPGLEYEYSNFGMSLLGFFAGRSSREGSLRAALAQRVTGPLGMGSTTFEPASVPGTALATGYAKHEPPVVAPLWNLGASEAAGGLWSSLDDMARWLSFQLSAWPPRPGPELGPLRRATLREQHMASFPVGLNASLEGSQPVATARAIGLGWHTRQSCDNEHLVEHGGAIDGFRASVAFAPERGFGVVLLSNAIDTRLDALEDELVKLSVAALPAREPRPAPGMLAALAALAGSIESCPSSSYEALFSRSFRASIRPEQHAAVCAELGRHHGRCQVGETLSLDGPWQGEFLLSCERGAIRTTAVVIGEDGQSRFSGLLVRSTGFPATPALALAAKRALKLYERWDDDAYAEAFADPGFRERLRDGMARIFASLGSCKLASDALTGPYSDGARGATLPLVCERGGAQELELSIDAGGKLTSILVREAAGKPRGGCR
jgi:CubicO group peptidase (beta-lactamase class C family)